MTETPARIRWTEDAALSIWAGRVGKCGAQLFTIAAPATVTEGFLLMSRLPGMDFSCSRSRLEEAQAEAERWLEEFTASLGATFAEPAAPSCATCGRPATGTSVTVPGDRQHRTWCSEECRDADAEQAHEQKYRSA
jgi:endogenous inhibitor of DNA gyrase (YacG/DUF329 family)